MVCSFISPLFLPSLSLFSFPLVLSLFPLSVCLCLSHYLSFSLYLYISIIISIYLLCYLTLSPSLILSLSRYLSHSLNLSTYLSHSVSLSIYLSLFPLSYSLSFSLQQLPPSHSLSLSLTPFPLPNLSPLFHSPLPPLPHSLPPLPLPVSGTRCDTSVLLTGLETPSKTKMHQQGIIIIIASTRVGPIKGTSPDTRKHMEGSGNLPLFDFHPAVVNWLPPLRRLSGFHWHL